MLTHKPVLLDEVISELSPVDGGIYIDCTFGAGGHSRAILNAANCFLHAFDRDEIALDMWRRDFNQYAHRTQFTHDCFSNALSSYSGEAPDGILIDLGISSMQLDDPKRGFSFMNDGPLSMQMGKGSDSAYNIVNYESEEEIARMLFYYGDEFRSRRIARAIVRQRDIKPIETTLELANIVRRVYEKKWHKTDPATKTFMAIRMAANDELEELLKAIEISVDMLKVNGKLLIISFNSSEDRIIKNFITQMNKEMNVTASIGARVSMRAEIGKKIKPSREEVDSNVRARSAGLRVIRKLA